MCFHSMCSVVEGFISSSLRCVLVCMWKVTRRKYSEVSGSRDVCVNDRPNKPTRRPRLTYHTSQALPGCWAQKEVRGQKRFDMKANSLVCKKRSSHFSPQNKKVPVRQQALIRMPVTFEALCSNIWGGILQLWKVSMRLIKSKVSLLLSNLSHFTFSFSLSAPP